MIKMKASSFVLLLCVFECTIGQYNSGYVPKYLQKKYGLENGQNANSVKIQSANGNTKTSYGSNKSYTKTKTYGSSSHIANLSKDGTKTKFRGGCATEPPTPMNAAIRCSQYSGCRIDCIPQYQFPDGSTQLFVMCENGGWKVEGAAFDRVPSCEPICMPPCMNGGICYAPNQCNCAENFSGPQCQFENKPCLNFPPMPVNARRTCRPTTCTITCMEGHQFPDGSSIAQMICKNGNWVPAKDKWVAVPDCEATCTPPCLNGGNCLSFNVCQCPQDFRGPQCQYRSDACNARKLMFNGGYNCSGDAESFSCSISCPEDISFEFPPYNAYTCYYSTGVFTPSPIPQCNYAPNMNVIPVGTSSHSFFHDYNSTFNMNSMSVNGNTNFGIGRNIWNIPVLPPTFSNESNAHVLPMIPGITENQYMIVQEKLPEPSSCFTWGGTHFKTFDGKVFSFNSECAHTLVRDAENNIFSVTVQNNKPNCNSDAEKCYRIIKIYLNDKEYVLKQDDNGIPIFATSKKTLPIPGQVPGIRVQMLAHFISVSLDTVGLKIKWDGKHFVQAEAKENLWNRTEGLCGKVDGDPKNDLISKDGLIPATVVNLALSWQVDTIGDSCNEIPTETHACTDEKLIANRTNRTKNFMSYTAMKFCQKLLQDKRFEPCHKVMDVSTLLDACRWDYCSCTDPDPRECACETLNVYIRQCFHKGIKSMATWRDENTCPMSCTDGKVYMPCGPAKGQPVCGASMEMSDNEEDSCVEGCYCPEGTVMHDSTCITRDQCPCRLRGKSFPAGSSVPKDCNTCTCSEGQWVCTQVSCGARCSAIGDPHYITFDGKRYDFMGQCSYYLVQTDNFTIEAENVACAGSISQAMNLPVSVSAGLPSCTKTVTIKMGGKMIKLKQNHELIVDGKEILKLPYKIGGITIRSISSIFVQVKLPGDVEIWWDGVTRAYIDVPASLKDKTKGLCGTFNNNQKDDFLTPEWDVEQSTIPFANKWKASEKCNDIPDRLLASPCDMNIQNKLIAEKHCRQLKSDLFKDCHWYVDPESFYQDCMYDMCSCETKISKCLCPMLSAYAQECAAKGVKINWREEVRECGIHCPGGQKYQVCGNTCTRSCHDIATQPDCKPQCVEGCNCPEGQALNDLGECIPMGQCSCQLDGIEFPAGYKEVRPASKAPELCTCINAQWSCRTATPEEIKEFPSANDKKGMCSASKNMEFTTCEPVEPTTCKNMHSQELVSAAVCHPGCQCKSDFVWDSTNKVCVHPTECPCHHGGKSYNDKATVQIDCNKCTCKNGKWTCSDRQCAAECSTWGDSHFKTFDGKLYDYQGQCDYIFAKGVLGNDDSFDIALQNVPCGSLGVSCSKSITIKIGSGTQQETIKLERDKPIPDNSVLKRLTVRHEGLLVIGEASDLGLIVHWDKGTRVYVKVDPRWKSRVKGLCGNYNDDQQDDFQTPSGGIAEASTNIFGDSWRLQSYCPEAVEVTNTCEERPERKIWALKQCGVLKTSLFAHCHSEVPIDSYFDRCVFDTCACDQGGDCECLCTALAAYAQECNTKGVPIKWRSQELCPMQCDERCSQYSPCISTCPLETCDNLPLQGQLSKLCKEDACIEGCRPKPCPPGEVYVNSSHLECIPRSVCKPICLNINDIVYYEGDLIEEDDCHSCYCSRGKKKCKGVPCATNELVVSTPKPQKNQVPVCQDGWTDWINQDKEVITKTKSRGKPNDVEPVPGGLIMNSLKGPSKCNQEEIVDIRCRTVKGHIEPKETGLDVECSLERGLICKSTSKGKLCPDFEIQVLCQCENGTTETVVPEYVPCDVAKPNQEHPSDCHLFYQCVPALNGPELVEKTCGSNMMYNPNTQVCDWPDNVIKIREECGEKRDTVSVAEKQPTKCPPGEVFEDCALNCNQMCLYYSYVVKKRGECKKGTECASGCVSAHKNMGKCPPGMFWADSDTCVAIHDCLCYSDSGKPVKPGVVYKESECKICQCIDNFYACDTSSCTEKITEEPEMITTVAPILITHVPSTVTPPKECDADRFINLIQGDQPLPDDAFNATTALGSAFEAKFARIDDGREKLGDSWSPEVSNKDQYLQIDLGRQEPIYGVIMKGSPLFDQYVTSYSVLYSPEGHNYEYVFGDDGKPKVFGGSIDSLTPVRQLFDKPIEAKMVRINPLTWHNSISIKVELIGCGDEKRTTSPNFITVGLPINFCTDTMGLQDGTMSDQQLSVSSEFGPNNNKKHLKLNDQTAWQPLTNSPTEWIQIDFLEPRNVTGIMTQGGPNGWVTAYKVKFSHDHINWNSFLSGSGDERLFPANFDRTTTRTNHFERPLAARYIRIVPKKWKFNIQMRVEPQGCFVPYPETEEMTTVAPSPCNYCPGVQQDGLELNACRCHENLFWDGENCVARNQCPCMVGHIPYTIGTIFEKEDCSECICKLGGVAHCSPKKCDKCEKGLRSVITSTCACICQPCGEGMILCPTSNICINETYWCNGIQDCPDDEVNCATTVELDIVTIPPTETTIITEKPKECPKVECPPGYAPKSISRTRRYHSYLSPMFSVYGRKTTKSSYKGLPTKTGVKGGYRKPMLKPKNITSEPIEEKCPEFTCRSTLPPPPIPLKECLRECPPGFVPLIEQIETMSKTKACPTFSCHPMPPPDAVCNVTGRTFNTFDETEYKYDICSHILARDLDNDEWDVSLKKNCTFFCTRDLIVRHQEHNFVLHPDLSVEYDGYRYTVEQTKKIGSQSQFFSISRLGNTLLFVSNRYGFWLMWDRQGNVKVGVARKLSGKVDGLCGYFNENPDDDKRKPDGIPARTTVDFGDSWAQADQPLICEAKACPLHIQNKAWDMCNQVKDQAFEPCAKSRNAFISRCLESTCLCLEAAKGNETAEEECRCETLTTFVVDCLTADSSLELIDWRMKHDCPAACEAPLVYHDCYQRRCEHTCETVSDSNLCPKLPHICFPGCYCPPGYVKNGNDCILPSTCRDCECNVLPHLQYVTYDETNFTINGNCVYTMSRDEPAKDGKHKFQVLITNAPCENQIDKMCVGKVTVLYEGHKIHILRDSIRHKLKVIIDGERLDDFSEVDSWAPMRQTPTKHIKILLKKIQVAISVYFPSLGVSVKAPSHKYSGKLEGLCGDCNKNPDNDMSLPNGTLTDDVQEFGLGWLYDNLPGGQSKESCSNKPKEECPPIPIDSDPCVQLLDIHRFGQCHALLDPSMFIEWCQKDTCGNHPEMACTPIEAYARDCLNSGFCVNWRSDLCPAKGCPSGMNYEQCGTSCPITCDNYKEKDRKCTNKPTEGCFCPEGKVFSNDTCVDVSQCEVCDEEGHHPGDVWNKDACTTCSCEGTNLKCETKHCPQIDALCEKGFVAVKTEGDKCCDEFICVPEATASPTCEPPQKLLCASGQVMKIDTKPDGCQQFICQCKPIEECEPINATLEAPLEEGYERVVNDSGCCPTVELVCKEELCPKPVDCPQYYKQIQVPGKCCPHYQCKPPADKCIFDTSFTADENGGERARTKYEQHKLLKDANDTWYDGPCRECKCLNSSNGYQATCSRTECPLAESATDFSDYVIEAVLVFNQCCPNLVRTACKDEDKVYKVGEKWSPADDRCTINECIESPQKGVTKQTQVTNCDTTCDLGWEYQAASLESEECCGSCKPVACVVDGIVRNIGEEWTSADFCTNFFCINVNGSLQVQSIIKNCPKIPQDMQNDYVLSITTSEGECCPNHKIIGCKEGTKEYKLGDNWSSPDGDKCKQLFCAENDGKITKQVVMESCDTDCKLGFEYKASNISCCGKCEPVACVVDGSLKQPNENWTAVDGCTTYVCEKLGDQFTVVSQQESCPSIDDCAPENVYVKGCCQHCNVTSLPQGLCTPEEINGQKTVGLVKQLKPPHGQCKNKQPLEGFTECIGSCHSSTFFDSKTGKHESMCTCCQVTKYKPLLIELTCEDGYRYKKQIAVPSHCGCEGCTSAEYTNNAWSKKGGVKTG